MRVIIILSGFLIAGIVFPTASWEQSASTQNASRENDILTSVQTLFANQPDCVAYIAIVLVKDAIMQRFAKKQGKTRCEFSVFDLKDGNLQKVSNDRITVIAYPSRTWIGLDPQEKTYSELPESFRPDLLDAQELYKRVVRTEDEHKVIVENVGAKALNGHRVQKIRVSFKGNKPENGIFFYVAKDLKNLIIKMEVNDLYEDQPSRKGEKLSLSLSNVSLNVPDALFQIPKGYRRVEFNSFISTIKRRTLK